MPQIASRRQTPYIKWIGSPVSSINLSQVKLHWYISTHIYAYRVTGYWMENKEKISARQIKKGDTAFFKELFDIYYQRLFLYARSYIGDQDIAEDLVQDMFCHLWEKRKDLVIFTSLSSYLFRAIHNRCIQYLRHRKVAGKYREIHKMKLREAEIMYNRATEFSFSEQQVKEIRALYDQTSQRLPEKTREIFRMSREDGLTNQEISDSLGISIKTVEYHMSKALKSFRMALKEYF